MKIKTWEKFYWGFILSLLILILIIVLASKEITYRNYIGGKTTSETISKGKAIGYGVALPFGFFLLLWLIIKALTGGFSDNSE